MQLVPYMAFPDRRISDPHRLLIIQHEIVVLGRFWLIDLVPQHGLVTV